MKYLTIKVGSGYRSPLITFNYPESGFMPCEVSKWFADVVLHQVGYITISTVSESLINLIGELVEEGVIDYKKVIVKHEHGTSWYNKDGTLTDWPYGLFNY